MNFLEVKESKKIIHIIIIEKESETVLYKADIEKLLWLEKVGNVISVSLSSKNVIKALKRPCIIRKKINIDFSIFKDLPIEKIWHHIQIPPNPNRKDIMYILLVYMEAFVTSSKKPIYLESGNFKAKKLK